MCPARCRRPGDQATSRPMGLLSMLPKSTGSSTPALVTPRKRLWLTQDLVGSSPCQSLLPPLEPGESVGAGLESTPGGASSRKAIWMLGPSVYSALLPQTVSVSSYSSTHHPLSPSFVADSVEGTTCVTALSSKTTLQTDVIVSLPRWGN